MGQRQPALRPRRSRTTTSSTASSACPVAIVYIVANIALGIHLFHGAWSMFQSLGLNNPRCNIWRRYFATAFAVVITVGNVSMPLLITTGVVTQMIG